MPGCQQCSARSAPPDEEGTLYIAAPVEHVQLHLHHLLTQAAIPFTEPQPLVTAILLPPDGLRQVGGALTAGMSPLALADMQALVLATGQAPTIGDLLRTQSLLALVAQVRSAWVRDLLREGRLVTHFQPIVPSAAPGELFGYECLMRGLGTDGELIAPGRIIEAARAAGLLFQLDQQARLAAIAGAVAHKLRTKIFINFNPTAIYNPAYCLRRTVNAIQAAHIAPEQVVFEVVESDAAADVSHLQNILDFYRKAGFHVALDDLGAGYSSLVLLAQLRPDFLKLDRELIAGVDRDPYKAQIAAKLLELAHNLDIPTIAEGVETAEELDWAQAHGATYIQGFYIARPALPPPQLSAGLSAARSTESALRRNAT